MSGYPLKAVWDLRRREEEAAAARLADATRERVAAEAVELHRVAKVAAARARWDDARQEGAQDGTQGAKGARQRGDPDGPMAAISANAAAERSRFVARRREELRRAKSDLVAFRSGPLAKARGAETTARDLHLAARRAREAFDKHEAKFRAGTRKIAERREEETLDDIARAARHPRGERRS